MTVRSPQPWARNGNAQSVHYRYACQFGRPQTYRVEELLDNYFWTVSRLPSPGGFKTYSSTSWKTTIKHGSSISNWDTSCTKSIQAGVLGYWDNLGSSFYTNTSAASTHDQELRGLRASYIAFSAIGFKFTDLLWRNSQLSKSSKSKNWSYFNLNLTIFFGIGSCSYKFSMVNNDTKIL